MLTHSESEKALAQKQAGAEDVFLLIREFFGHYMDSNDMEHCIEMTADILLDAANGHRDTIDMLAACYEDE